MHAFLTDIMTDLVQNGTESGAERLSILFDEGPDEVRIVVDDDGKGMDKATLAKSGDPFWSDGEKHPGRRVGLGIPFLKQTAEQCGGRAEITSSPRQRNACGSRFFPPAMWICRRWGMSLCFGCSA